MVSTAQALSFAPTVRTVPRPQPATGTRRLWLCAHFPELSLEVLTIDPACPAAVVEERKGRPFVHSVTRAARQAGIDTGMTMAAAHALCHELAIRMRDPVAEQAALFRLAEAGLDFTPWASLDQPGSLLLEIGASLKLFGGPESLRERLRQSFLSLGHRPVIAITPSSEASGLLARCGAETIMEDRHGLRSALGQIPASALFPDEKTLRRMLRIGIRHLADLWRLPRDGLARRYGAEFLRWLDGLAGAETKVLSTFHRPPRFAARREMPTELERLDHFFPAVAQLADELAAFLRGHDAAALGLTLDLLHHGQPATRIELRFRSANRDAAHWLLLLREKLERIALPSPVAALMLRSGAIVPFEPEQTGLFGDPKTRQPRGIANGDPQPHNHGPVKGREWQAVLERLQARLGHPALKRLTVLDDHRPERAMGQGEAAANPPSDWPARPLWLLVEPQPLKIRDLQWLSEPERIESGWWDGASIRRDYCVARDRRGRRLWVFRDLNGTGGWYLHGLFG